MNVRRARPDDAEAMAEALRVVAEEGRWIATEPPVDVAERAARFREAAGGAEGDAMWVAEDGGRVVGMLGLHPGSAAGVLSLGMAVLADARGRGGGGALLDAALAHARARRLHKLELEVFPDNARAIALYAARGFEVEGVRRDHYLRRDGSRRSSLLMALRLTDS